MDIATIIGMIAGVSLLLWAIMGKSSLSTFMDPGSVAIVFGGSVSAALVGFPINNVLAVAKVVKNCFFAKSRHPQEIITQMVKFAEVARRDGILSLESHVKDVDDPFIVSGVQMAVDGTDPALIEAILMSDLEAVEERHEQGKALFDSIGRYAPAFGMIGTLVGLVIMLQNMDDPSKIGPAMAVALLTTLYGAIAANLFAMPMADKLALRSKQEILLKMIVIKGVMAIQSGDNPRIVEQKLKTFLPYSRRESRQSEAA